VFGLKVFSNERAVEARVLLSQRRGDRQGASEGGTGQGEFSRLFHISTFE
jgi:hypothetical protein